MDLWKSLNWSPEKTSAAGWWMASCVPTVVVMLALVVVGGCRPDSAKQKIGKDKNTSVSVTNEPEQTPAQKTLDSIVQQLQPENIYINSDPSDVVNLLNSWMRSAGTFAPVDTSRLPNDFLTPQETLRLDTHAFDYIDAVYLARCFLAQKIIAAQCPGELSDLERVVRLFEFSVRNISLPAEGEPIVPTRFDETLAYGWGIRQSRTVVFASLVGQLGFPTVVLTPAESANYLVGVVLEGEVYLFEPTYGIPIPAGGKALKNGRIMPATLRDVLSNPKSFDCLTPRSDVPYPISVDSLREARVQICAEPEEWLPRMEALEQSIVSQQSTRLYRPLNDSGDRAGLIARVCAGHADWKPEAMRVWTYPWNLIKMRAVLENPEDRGHVREKAFLEVSKMAMESPFEKGKKAVSYNLTFDPAKGEVVRKSSENEESEGKANLVPRNLRRTIRILQLTGRYEDAIRSSVSRQRLREATPPAGKELAYQVAAEDMEMISAIAKFESGDFEGAVESVETYTRNCLRGQNSGRWRALLRWTMAHSEMRQGNSERAVGLLASTDFAEPNAAGVAVLLNLWKSRGEPVKTEPAKGEPVKTEPAKTESSKGEPSKAEPEKPKPEKPDSETKNNLQ